MFLLLHLRFNPRHVSAHPFNMVAEAGRIGRFRCHKFNLVHKLPWFNTGFHFDSILGREKLWIYF